MSECIAEKIDRTPTKGKNVAFIPAALQQYNVTILRLCTMGDRGEKLFRTNQPKYGLHSLSFVTFRKSKPLQINFCFQ